jgi:hypothetical protein
MTNPVNLAIYAFGGFMLFALAIVFCRAGLNGETKSPQAP